MMDTEIKSKKKVCRHAEEVGLGWEPFQLRTTIKFSIPLESCASELNNAFH